MKKDQNETARVAADAFITVLNTQSTRVRREVIARMLADENLREDVEAALLYEARKDEKTRPFSEYLKEYEARRR